MNKKALLVVILAVVAASLAYVAFTQGQKSPGDAPSGEQATSTVVASGDLTYEQALAIFTGTKYEENPSQESVARYSEAVRRLATSSPQLSFYSCEPTPKVIEIAAGDALKVRNAGTSTIEVRFKRDVTRSIAPGATIEVAGVYVTPSSYQTISCNKRGPVGAVLISE